MMGMSAGAKPIILAALSGLSAALLPLSTGSAAETVLAPSASPAALSSPSLAGRWSGTPYAITNDTTRCENGACLIVLDIVACGAGWCGIEVDRANACASELMQLTPHSDLQRRNAFQGKLSLAKGTQEYIVDVTADDALDGQPAGLEIVGDTGPEFRWFRRSFPFHAALTRIGDAVCRSEVKPLS
ncbi:MAG: hypothetical protein ACM3L9_06415 [Deltaproteobacteria bacterium]